MGYGLLNLGSLLLGLIAWLLPVINLANNNKAEHKNWVVISISSVGTCAIALYMQILYGNHLVKIKDWSALMDTSHGVALVSAILLVAITLNAITVAVYCKNDRK